MDKPNYHAPDLVFAEFRARLFCVSAEMSAPQYGYITFEDDGFVEEEE